MRRSQVELNHEYERLLERDKSPFSFLYNGIVYVLTVYRETNASPMYFRPPHGMGDV